MIGFDVLASIAFHQADRSRLHWRHERRQNHATFRAPVFISATPADITAGATAESLSPA